MGGRKPAVISRLMRRLGLVLAVLVLAPPAANAAFPGRNGLIVFYRTPAVAGPSGIYVVDPAGGGERLIKQQGLNEGFQGPTWSPDGSKIAYTLGHSRVPDIEVMAADGSGVKRVTNTGDAVDPAWSPDASMMAFRTQMFSVQGYFAIFVMNAGGTRPRLLGPGIDADWSPDCSRVAFVRPSGEFDRRFEIHTIAADGTDRRLTSGPYDGQPSWSPDGRQLAFARSEGNRTYLYVVNADGTGERRLRPIIQEPAWSPDGRQIAFVGENVNLWVINADGTGARAVTATGPAFLNVQPDWQPVSAARPDPHLCDAWRAGPAGPAQPLPRLRLSVRPRRTRVGKLTRFRFKSTVTRHGRRRPLRGVRIRFAGRRLRTNRRGRASVVVRFRSPGHYRVRATKRGYARVVVRVQVLRRR